MSSEFGLSALFFGLALVLGVMGFFLALDAGGRVKGLERSLRDLEAEFRDLRARLGVAPAPPASQPRSPPAARVPVSRTEPANMAQKAPLTPALAAEVSLEQRIGTRWAVYVGGLALAFGSLLLVRYALEQGFFGPAARVLLGLALAGGLIAGGEFLRRREKRAGGPTPTPAVLTAAGVTAGFGAIYAAHALYGFIGPALAFFVLGAFGLGAMFAALWHGPAIAGFGLAGALAAPLFVQSAEPNPWPLVIYVGVVAAASYGLARRRQWVWLAIASVGGAAIWGLVLTSGQPPDFPWAAEIHFVLQLAMACYAFALSRVSIVASPRERSILAHAGPLGLALISIFALAVCADRGRFDLSWTASAAGIVGLLAISGAARPSLAPGLLAGAGLSAAYLLLSWPTDGARFELHSAPPLFSLRFQVFAAVSATAVATLAGHSLWRRVEISNTAAILLAATSALAPLVLLSISYLRLSLPQTHPSLGLVALAISFAFLAAATAFRRRDADGSNDRLALGAFASATMAALALGFAFTLDHGMLTVALALSALGAAFVESRLDIPALRHAVAAAGLVVAARLVLDPSIVGGEVGATPIFNWLLWGYGVPALSFGLAARFLGRKSGEDSATQIAEALATIFTALLVFFQIRHLLHHGSPFVDDIGLIESGLYVICALGFSTVLAQLNLRRASPTLHVLSLAFAVVAAVVAAAALAVWTNPYIDEQPVLGGLWFNSMLLGYALPGLCAALFANLARANRPLWFVRIFRLVALMLIFLYLTLETRRHFHGQWIGWSQPSGEAEHYAYSAVWLALGVILLAYGLLRHWLDARVASAAVIVLAVLKVFIFDLAHLVGAQRAFSFIGLGFVLIGIGLVYQKLVFRPHQSPDLKA